MTGPFDVALDAMGGDHAPLVEVQAALSAAEAGSRVVLVGDDPVLRRALREHSSGKHPAIEIRHAPEAIGMDEKPSVAVRRKKGASVRIAAEMVASGEARAMVSAGNSGGVMAAALFAVGRIPGVIRPALGGSFATRGLPAAVLDLGANIDPTAVQLAQFAILGDAYARAVLGRERPKVALLTNGSEEAKGTQTTREAAELLQRSEINYVGYCEGRQVFTGEIDVIVIDGFTGNVVLKTLEGLVLTVRDMIKEEIEGNLVASAGALLMRSTLKRVAAKLDYEAAGASPLLGLKGWCWVAHGGSTVRALSSALSGATRLLDKPLFSAIESSIQRHTELGLFKQSA